MYHFQYRISLITDIYTEFSFSPEVRGGVKVRIKYIESVKPNTVGNYKQ